MTGQHVCDTPFWRTDDDHWICPDCGQGYVWRSSTGTVSGVPASVCTVRRNWWEPTIRIPAGGAITPINSTDVIVSERLPTYPDHREDARRTVWSGRLAQQVLAKDGKPPAPAPGEPSHVFAAGDGTRNGPVTLVVSRQMWGDLLAMQQRINEAKARLQ